MENDAVSMMPAHPPRTRSTRVDRTSMTPWGLSDRACVGLALLSMAIGFVVLGVDGLDLSPKESRLGLAAGGSAGPMGQVYGYWAPDLWPGEVLPGLGLARLSAGGRPANAAVRWPAAIAAILGGCLLATGMHRALGYRAGILSALCWFSSLAIIDRSAGSGLDMILGAPAGSGLDLIVGVATMAVVDRLLRRGADLVAGLWAASAFLAGGWPPLLLVALVILVVGRPGSYFSIRLIAPPVATAIVWSFLAIRAASIEAWASAMTLPLTRRPELALPLGVVLLGLPWAPFAMIGVARSVRAAWPAAGRAWIAGWLKAAVACAIAGAAVPGLGPAARVVALAGVLIAAAAGLDAAWKRTLTTGPRRLFHLTTSAILALWLVAMMFASFAWIVAMPYYRALGIVMGVVAIAVAVLGWSALGWDNTRRSVVTMAVLAAAIKLAHWGYYAPEWNYRFSQGPWGRAIGQWLPRKWPIYTFNDWLPADLAFAIGRPIRQLPTPRLLPYQPGSDCRFVLLQAAELANWPDQSPPLTVITRMQDRNGEERILARTPGALPAPGRPIVGPSDGPRWDTTAFTNADD